MKEHHEEYMALTEKVLDMTGKMGDVAEQKKWAGQAMIFIWWLIRMAYLKLISSFFNILFYCIQFLEYLIFLKIVISRLLFIG